MKTQSNYFRREWFIYGLLILIALLIIGKLIFYQIINAAELKARAATFRTSSQAMIYERGMITDAQANVLAKSVPARDIYADPKSLTNSLSKALTAGELENKIQEIAHNLAQILAKDPQEVLNLLKQDASWVSLARQVDIETAKQISDLAIPGIGFTDTYKRVYPTGTMASSVLGIVNMAGDGVEGLEYFYNSELKGEKEIKASLESEVTNSPLKNEFIQTGYNISLTLDSTIQHLVEQELDKIIEECKPQRAVILAMDPMTGKILGMGSRPNFDPNNYTNTKQTERKNLALSMIYEPGSTFKIITGAAALEENVVNPNQIFNDPGYIIVGSKKITNWDSDFKAHGNITFSEGMKLSSNVVLAQVGKLLGKDVFYTYLKSFGFGTRSKIDIAGEEQGLLIDKKNVKDLELATMSFGQANLVTPMQLLTAICAVANGGKLYQPYILDKISSKDGEILFINQPKVVREVISETTSKTMTNILVEVVEDGTGGRAKIPGIKVAGKTGTAQKINPETGTYSATDFIVSFVGYAPAENPKIAVLVVIDTPRAEIVQGGTLAGPHVKKIIESALQYYGIPVAAGTPSDIQEISPDPLENPTPPDSNVPEQIAGEGEVTVPNLKGLTMRQAGVELRKHNLRYKFVGSGLVFQQFPEPGKVVNQGDTIEVIFHNDDITNPNHDSGEDQTTDQVKRKGD
ncbi:MAG: penicillin-binding protein [Desulfitobacteriia bacterium]|jgi:stage V sporulation protein D (sporulation-specific penicillin-binding protein)